MKRSAKKTAVALAPITPSSPQELIALIQAGWLSAQTDKLLDGEEAFHQLHAYVARLAAKRTGRLPVIYA